MAQTENENLDQVRLVKKIFGKWKIEIDEHKIMVTEYRPFGNGFLGHSRIEADGEILMESQQLYGYDPQKNKFIEAELSMGGKVVVWSIWFTSENSAIAVPIDFISNPEQAVIRIETEIKSPEVLLQTEFKNNKPMETFTAHREL